MENSSRFLCAISAGVLLCASPGSALTLTGVSAPGSFQALGATYQTVDTPGFNPNNYVNTTNPTGSVQSPQGISTARWDATFGALHAGADTTLPGDSSAQGSLAILGISWLDWFQATPVSGSLSSFDITLTITLNGTLLTNAGGGQDATASVAAGWDDPRLGNLLFQEGCTGSQNCAPNINVDDGLQAASATFSVNCPATGDCWVGLRGWLELFTLVRQNCVGVCAGSASADADYFSTATFHLDVLTPGWTVTSLSGTDYSTPAPEPSILLLSGFGLGLSSLLRRRKAALPRPME